jgi:transcription elongation factor SPT6
MFKFLIYVYAVCLWGQALWAVQHWDKKWLLLQGRKISLQAAYERRIPIDTRDDPEKEDLVEKLLHALMDAPSEQAVDDVDAKFNLHFPPDEVEIVANGFKRPKRKSFYSICRKAGLASMAKHFGLSPDQFGENLLLMYKVAALVHATCTVTMLAFEWMIWMCSLWLLNVCKIILSDNVCGHFCRSMM